MSETEVKELKNAGEKLAENIPSMTVKTVFTTNQTKQVGYYLFKLYKMINIMTIIGINIFFITFI